MSDPDLELLSVIHTVQSTSQDLQKGLAIAIERSEGSTVTIPIKVAIALKTILAVEGKIMTEQVEHNRQIIDQIDALVARLEAKA